MMMTEQERLRRKERRRRPKMMLWAHALGLLTEDFDDWTVVTVDGSPAAHWEHTVAVTVDGPRILTPRPRS